MQNTHISISSSQSTTAFLYIYRKHEFKIEQIVPMTNDTLTFDMAVQQFNQKVLFWIRECDLHNMPLTRQKKKRKGNTLPGFKSPTLIERTRGFIPLRHEITGDCAEIVVQ